MHCELFSLCGEVMSGRGKGRKGGAKSPREVVSDRNKGSKSLGAKDAKRRDGVVYNQNRVIMSLGAKDNNRHREIVSCNGKESKGLGKQDVKSRRKSGSGKGGKGPGKVTAKRHREIVSRHGKESKGLGKQDVKSRRKSGSGKGSKAPGKVTVKRSREVHRDIMQNITKAAIRRLARRSGVKQISDQVLEESRRLLKDFLEIVIRGAIIFADLANRKTITAMDVVNSVNGQRGILF